MICFSSNSGAACLSRLYRALTLAACVFIATLQMVAGQASHPLAVETWWSLARHLDDETGQFTTPISSCENLHLSSEQLLVCEADTVRGYAKMKVAARSSLATVRECRRQFQEKRWNCHSFNKPHHQGPLFGTVIQLSNTREAGFVHALMSASVAHEAADACSKGQLHDCLCAALSPEAETDLFKKIPPSLTVNKTRKNDPQSFSWGGCHANVEYGLAFAEKFAGSGNVHAWTRARKLMNKHNAAAGRNIVKANMIVRCKCHGLSGSCSVKVCWRELPSFQKIGNLLQGRYQNATRMKLDDTSAILTRYNPLLVAPSKEDLVYIDHSPSYMYCNANATLGIPGTAGRQCRLRSNTADSCNVLCCDRGFDRRQEMIDSKCRCRFVWCCEVKCDQCRTAVDKHYCK